MKLYIQCGPLSVQHKIWESFLLPISQKILFLINIVACSIIILGVLGIVASQI